MQIMQEKIDLTLGGGCATTGLGLGAVLFGVTAGWGACSSGACVLVLPLEARISARVSTLAGGCAALLDDAVVVEGDSEVSTVTALARILQERVRIENDYYVVE